MAGCGALVAGGTVVAALAGVMLWQSSDPTRSASDTVKIVRTEDAGSPTPLPRATDRPTPALATPAVSISTGAMPPVPSELDQLPDPRAMARAVRAEPRDPGWAPGAEAGLRDQLARLPYMATTADRLSVHCATSLCEVSGAMPAGVSPDNLNVMMAAMQGAPLNDGLTQIGMNGQGVSFSSGGKADDGRFVIWTKKVVR